MLWISEIVSTTRDETTYNVGNTDSWTITNWSSFQLICEFESGRTIMGMVQGNGEFCFTPVSIFNLAIHLKTSCEYLFISDWSSTDVYSIYGDNLECEVSVTKNELEILMIFGMKFLNAELDGRSVKIYEEYFDRVLMSKMALLYDCKALVRDDRLYLLRQMHECTHDDIVISQIAHILQPNSLYCDLQTPLNYCIFDDSLSFSISSNWKVSKRWYGITSLDGWRKERTQVVEMHSISYSVDNSPYSFIVVEGVSEEKLNIWKEVVHGALNY